MSDDLHRPIANAEEDKKPAGTSHSGSPVPDGKEGKSDRDLEREILARNRAKRERAEARARS